MASSEKSEEKHEERKRIGSPTVEAAVAEALLKKAKSIYRGEALAPMVRASTTPLRTLALSYGADWVYTEELVDRALTGTIRVENKELGTIDYVKDASTMSKKSKKQLAKEGRAPIILRIDPKKERGKLVCQLGSGEPDLALAAALHVHQDVDAIDLNMGCPKKFSVSGGMGSALLSDPERAFRIIRTLTENLSSKGIPVSAKIRLLKDVPSTMAFIAGLVEAGAKAIAVHGRQVSDECTVPARWSMLREVIKEAVHRFPHIPFLLNGDFYTRDEFVSFMRDTGARGVLLARPALFNTSIFCKPSPDADPSLKLDYTSSLLLDKTRVVQEYIQEAVKYDTHFKNVKYVVCEMLTNRRAPSPRTPFLTHNFAKDRTIATTCNCHSLQDICKVWGVDYSSLVEARNITGSQAPTGEHRYEDSYFLGDRKDVRRTELPGSEVKRARKV